MASEWKRFLEEEGYEKFKEAMRLSDEDSKDDRSKRSNKGNMN